MSSSFWLAKHRCVLIKRKTPPLTMIASHTHTRRRAACWLKPQSELRPRHETDKRRKGGGGGAVPHSRQGKWLGLLLRKRATLLLRNVLSSRNLLRAKQFELLNEFLVHRRKHSVGLTQRISKLLRLRPSWLLFKILWPLVIVRRPTFALKSYKIIQKAHFDNIIPSNKKFCDPIWNLATLK